MNFFKRGLKSIVRQKGKSLILFAVVLILGNVLAGAVSIQQGTKSVENAIKQQLGTSAMLVYDQKVIDNLYETESMEEIEKYFENGITEDMVAAIAGLSYVNYYEYSVYSYLQSATLKGYEEDMDGGMTSYRTDVVYSEAGGISSNSLTYFEVKGTRNPQMYDLRQGKIELREGREFTQEEIASGAAKIIISDKLAETNGVTVGDTLVIDYIEGEYGMVDGKEVMTPFLTMEMPFEIIGTFSIVENSRDGESGGNSRIIYGSSLHNTIYMPNATAKEFEIAKIETLMNENPERFRDWYGETTLDELKEMYDTVNDVVFILDSPENVENFKEEALPFLDNPIYKIVASTDKYDSIAAPIKGMERISMFVIYVSIGASLLIITLVVLLFLRDRKHELGVYLSLGEKKGKVITQILIEVMLISLLAVTLSVFSGNLLAQGVSKELIKTQTSEDNSSDYMGWNEDDYRFEQMGVSALSEDDVADSYQISLSTEYIFMFYLASLITVLLSVVVPLIYILRLNPKKIMM